MNIKCIHLDFDGTLADSISQLKDAYFCFLKSQNLKEDIIDFEKLNGPTLLEIVQIVKKTGGLKKDIYDLYMLYQAIIKDLYQHVKPMSGAKELVENAHKKNITINIVTSNEASIVNHWLTVNQFSNYISHIIDAHVAPNGKMTPEPYLQSIKKSRHSITNAIAIEDSALGAISASEAGLHTYFLNKFATTDQSTIPKNVIFIESLHNVASLIS